METRPEVETQLRQRRVPGGVNFPTRRTPEVREVQASVGVTLRLKALVELETRAIRTLYARKDLRRAPFDIWLKSAFSWVHHTATRLAIRARSRDL